MRNRSMAFGLTAAAAALLTASCSSTSNTASSTTTAGSGGGAGNPTTTTTAAGGGGGSSSTPGCEVLTVDEFKTATSKEVTLLSERRGQDLTCAYTSKDGKLLGELVVTQASVVKPVLSTNTATKKLDGVGDGAALAGDLQGYLVVGQAGFFWTTLSAGDVTAAQIEAIIRATAG